MAEITKLISNGQVDAAFVKKLQDFLNRDQDPTMVQKILTYLYSQSSSRIKNSDEIFAHCIEQSVVILVKYLLSRDLVQNLRASCLRAASNFSVIFHREGFERNNIIVTTVSCVVSIIQRNNILTSDELEKSLSNLIHLQTARLSKSCELPAEKRQELWDHLICLYTPMKDKTHLISLLSNSWYNPTFEVSYLESCKVFFTRHNVDQLFAVLDKYCAYFVGNNENDSSHFLDVSNAILNNVITEVQNFASDNKFDITIVLVYKCLFENAFQMPQCNEESMYDHLAAFNSKVNHLLALQSKREAYSNQLDSLCSSMVNHFTSIISKFIQHFRKAALIGQVLEMYRNLFKLAQNLRRDECFPKGRNQNLLKCWSACVSLITDNLNLEQLHENFVHTINAAMDCTMSMLLSVYRKTEEISDNDRNSLISFVGNIGILSQSVNKLGVDNRNTTINILLIRPVLQFFLAVPEQVILSSVAEYMANVLYNILKSSVSGSTSSRLLLECLEPVVLLACHSLDLVPHAAKTWIQLQYQYIKNQSQHEWVHLCDHIDCVLPQLRLKHPDVKFVDTSGPDFVLHAVKAELDEIFIQIYGYPEKEYCSYELAIVKRVLFLINLSPGQDFTLTDVCLSCINLIQTHEKLSSECAQLKAYVNHLKKVLKTMKSNSVRIDSEEKEQVLVTSNTLACLLLSSFYVLEHKEKVVTARLEHKKKSGSHDTDPAIKKHVVSDADKGIEQNLNETNVFPSELDDTDELVKLLDTAALILSKVIQSEVALDLDAVLRVIKKERLMRNILYVGYSYRLYLEGDKEIEFWKLSLQLGVLLYQDDLFVESVFNLLWLDEGLRPTHIKRADDIVARTNMKPALPGHIKTMYLFAKVKQSLSLNQLTKASEDLARIEINRNESTIVYNILPLVQYWYLNCLVLMKQTDLTPMQHADMVQCCEEAFDCLFRNYNTVSHTATTVIQILSCYLDITKLIIKFHMAHLNPREARRILSSVLVLTQDMCFPLWTAQLLSLSACVDVMTCNKEDLHFKTSCLEQILIQDISQRHSSSDAIQHKLAQPNASKAVNPSTGNGVRDSVVTKQSVTSSSLSSPRFVSTVSDKLPDFIAHRSCQCFPCRNSVYQELLISLELLRGLYYQLQKDYELTAFCFHNVEHLLNKLRILKGLPDNVASVWQGRLVFYRANLAGILNQPAQVLKLNQEYQLVTSSTSGEDYFAFYCDMVWQQEQYLMFVGMQVAKTTTPPRKINLFPPRQDDFKTPRVSKVNIGTVVGQNTVFPACKHKQDIVTPTTKAGQTLVFDEEDEIGEEKKENTPKKKEKVAVPARTSRKPRNVKMPVVEEDERWSPIIGARTAKKYKCYESTKKQGTQTAKPSLENTAFTPLVSDKFNSNQLSPRSSQSKSNKNAASRKVLFEISDGLNKLNIVETKKPEKETAKPYEASNQGKSEVREGKGKANKEKQIAKTKMCNRDRKNITNLVASKQDSANLSKCHREITESNVTEDSNVHNLTKNISDLKLKADLDVSNASSYHSCSTSPELTRPTRKKALYFDDEDMDIEDQTVINNKPTSTRETNSQSSRRAPAKSAKSGGKQKESVKAIPTRVFARKKATEKTDAANTVKSNSITSRHQKLVDPPATVTSVIHRKPVRKPVDVKTCELEIKQSKIGKVAQQHMAENVVSTQASRRLVKPSINVTEKTRLSKRGPIVSKFEKAESTCSSKSKSSSTSEYSSSPSSMASSDSRTSSDQNSSKSIKTDINSNSVSIASKQNKGSSVDPVKSSRHIKSNPSSGGSLLSSSSPSSVESLPVTNVRTARGLRCRKVIQSSSSSTSSPKSSERDSFHSVEVDQDEKKEDVIIKTSVPKSEKPKRKARAQFPKNPFIF